MTEEEWLQGTDPVRLAGQLDPRVFERKLRLFAAAACRRVGHLLDSRCRRVVELSERYADRAVAYDEVREAEARLKSDSTTTARAAQAAAAVGSAGYTA